mmetsp:Transcript_21860/g.33643  ORF Transcript_21860/g.33643 Transcript_21860/m.33643 type:complete len:452 (-) Transcript_21860:9-1364(-)
MRVWMRFFFDLIYQGRYGALVLAQDAASIGAVVTTKDEMAMTVLKQTSTRTNAEVKACLEAARKTNNTAAVEAVLKRTRQVLDEAVRKKELSAVQASDLRAHTAQRTRTDFGTRAEAAALEEYKLRTGNDITDCNDRLLIWNFPTDPTEIKLPKLCPDSADKKISKFDDSENQTLFRIIGKVDGIAHEIDYSDPDPECWSTKRVVIEIKNRVYRLNQPQLHDELQIVAYMHMTQCKQGDLVQRHARKGAVDTSTTRIELARHNQDWNNIVVPRLYQVANIIDALRRNDSRRREWLAANPNNRWLIAAELAPFLPLPPAHYRGAFFDNENHDVKPTLNANQESAKKIDPSTLDVLPKEIAEEIREQFPDYLRNEKITSSQLSPDSSPQIKLGKINSYFPPAVPVSQHQTITDNLSVKKRNRSAIFSPDVVSSTSVKLDRYQRRKCISPHTNE